MPSHDNLKILEGDIHDATAVDAALDDVEVVISALGSWHTPSKDILSGGMKAIIPGMKKRGISRIISLTGAEARAKNDALTPLHRIAHMGAEAVAGKILQDAEDHIRQLEESGMDWTVIRSPIMNESGGHAYRLSPRRPYPWTTVNRQAVAVAMVQQLNDSHFRQQAPFITR